MAASAGGFSVVISATDSASKTIDAINKKIASMQAPALRVQKSLAKFADVSGLNALGKGFQNLARYSLEAFRSLTRMVEPLAAITGALSVAGLVKLTTAFADFGSRLGFSAQRIGVTSDQLQSLQGAARLAGSSAQSLTSGMQNLGDTLTDAVGGRAPEAVVMMNTLGISFRDSVTGQARKASDVLPELADKIAAIKNPALQARAATALLGGSAEDLLPFLRLGAAGMADYAQQARFYGVVNDEAAAKARDLQMAQTKLQMAVEGLTNSIGEKLAPILGPLLTDMADWIAKNRDWIATGIGGKVQELADWLRSIDWKGVITGAQAWGDKIGEIVKALGGLKTVGEVVVGFFAASWLTGMVAPIMKILGLLAMVPGSGVAGAAVAAAAGVVGVAEVTAHGLSYLTGQGINDENRTYKGATPNEANRGHDPNMARRSGAGGRNAGPDQSAGAKQAYDYFTSQGWSPNQAAGLVANLGKESGFNQGAVGDSGAAYGLGQWHPDRQAAFKQQFGKDIRDSTRAEQLQFVQWELTHTEKGAGDKLRTAQTAADAGAIVSQRYERPAAVEAEAADRAQRAEEWKQQLAAMQPPPAPAAPLAAQAAAAQGPAANIQGGSGSNTPAGVQTVNGQANVNVRFANMPPGAQASASANGPLFAGAPVNIQRAMPGGAGV